MAALAICVIGRYMLARKRLFAGHSTRFNEYADRRQLSKCANKRPMAHKTNGIEQICQQAPNESVQNRRRVSERASRYRKEERSVAMLLLLLLLLRERHPPK